MLLIKEFKKERGKETEILTKFFLSVVFSVVISIVYGNLYIDKTATGKYGFKEAMKIHSEISGIFGIDDVALIKDISPRLEGLAQIELKPNTYLTNDAILNITNIASIKYKLNPKHIKIIQTDTDGVIQYFVVYDEEAYLSKNPFNFEYLPWSYFGKRDSKGIVIIGYFSYITIKQLDNSYFKTIYPTATCHSNFQLPFVPPSDVYQAKSDRACHS